MPAAAPHPPALPGAAAPPNLGAATTPQGNPGLAVKAMSDVRNAVTMLESALPHIPIGTPLHSEILNATKSLLKHLQPGEQNAGIDLMQLVQMARQQAANQPMAAMMRQFQPNQPPAIASGGPAMPRVA